MKHEDYVPFELAVMLKQCGFDWLCYAFYGVEPDGNPMLYVSPLPCVSQSDQKGRDVAAPTLAMAAKWLREVKGIDIDIIVRSKICDDVIPNIRARDYEAKLSFMGDAFRWIERSTYESALTDGLCAALESIKESME